ncbi:DUF349 domain-containing protein [Vandammella animalimorsus]|uniref:DUF349 domain-containing protein n=1 Tax=Vandammella animalimorsus TaxID=2029117 RepID=A0A2A2AJA8_9BURK|nr:DUF349 domain-containing protein [Vandammella animalimorsus]PAT38655.1 hypothetical protein CK625_04190 [Vandammella animalimorsus]
MALFPFFSRNKNAPTPAAPPAQAKAPASAPVAEPHPLDTVTGGIFSAENSAQRQERVAQWLQSQPDAALLQQVYKALSARDQGAAKPIRQRMNDIRQSQHQEEASQDWAAKAEKILGAGTFRIADGMAWLRDAAKAGAPLSKEPLAELRSRIAERVKALEDLQHKAMVQKEAAVLLAQRIDVLSTKPWQHASEAEATLAQDVQKWHATAQELSQAELWGSVEPRHSNAIDSSRVQLQQVFEAFGAALAQARQAAEDPQAPLPQVQVWADELRTLHGGQAAASAGQAAAPLSPEQQAKISAALKALEQTVRQGQAKQSSQAAAALRESLKELHGSVDAELERRINRALIDAGDLQGWQRWGANQVREELIARAEQLMDAQGKPQASGKALQAQVRELHEQWRQVDRSSPPNGHLWKRFDEAMGKARAVVDEWLSKVKAESQAHKAQRQAIIDELRAFAGGPEQASADLKALNRQLRQFAERWRNAGHVSDKIFTQLQTQWKEAYDAASAPLEQARKRSAELRRSLIEQAQTLAERQPLDIRAIKELQQRWQTEAQSVPLERRLELKLWDAFRQPLDAAFSRKSAQRHQAQAAASAHDQAVLQAAQTLEQAVASGDAQSIRDAMQALQGAVRSAPADATPTTATPEATEGSAPAAAAPGHEAAANAPTATSAQAQPAPAAAPEAAAADGAEPAAPAEDGAPAAASDDAAAEPTTPAASAAPAAAPARPVIAVRGDDRPGAQPASGAHSAARSARPGARPDARRERHERNDRSERHERHERHERRERPAAAPRLGDAAFRAQRQAMDNAQAALRKLAAQAHGETLTQLLQAWSQRDAQAVPAHAQLGKHLPASQYNEWKQQIGQAVSASSEAQAQALLRLEVAADVPTPAEHLSERRALQLQLLTQRHAAGPEQTWAEDVRNVLAGAADAHSSKRLQAALKVLLKRS